MIFEYTISQLIADIELFHKADFSPRRRIHVVFFLDIIIEAA